MPRDRGEPPAVRVYTVCEESKYLIVRNVPALGCGDELSNLFASYGAILECKPMDAEDCEAFTDVYWIKFSQVSNARFAKRKLDESVFLGNRLQISYAPQFESLSDVKEKLEGRRNDVLGRIKSGRTGGSNSLSQVGYGLHKSDSSSQLGQASSVLNASHTKYRENAQSGRSSYMEDPCMNHVSSDKDYFSSSSMNQTVRLVRDKLDKIKSSGEHVDAGPASKKTRVDNRRRI
ncbi:Uncharacterized protein M6B38_110420 [Iris pallida]|uniref:RNA-binding protein 48 n=1 Tax=Iris pallida TaxID=29817 RepID=A0AAX6DZH2_IRIPA|nr:Uncharacterized protein M6B38_110420 [Iris pallida]